MVRVKAERTVENGPLCIVPCELESFVFVLDNIGGNRRVVRHLFNEEISLPTVLGVRPMAIE
jgi:hypothetical protein